MPRAWKVCPFIERSSAISSDARSSSGSDSSRASRLEPSVRAIARRSVSFGSRLPFSIIESWLGARSTAAASSSSVIPFCVRSCRMRRPMVSASVSGSASAVERADGVMKRS